MPRAVRRMLSRPKKCSSERKFSRSVSRSSGKLSLNRGSKLTLVPMLKPLVTSSIVIGETPVTNSRSMLPARDVPAFSAAKKLR